MVSIAVIGAGLSGLSAAYYLAQHNVQITVFEAASHAGGVIHSESCDGYLVEYGPNSIEGMTPIVTEIIHDLGLEPQIIEASAFARRLYTVRAGKLQLVPSSPVSFLLSTLFSPLAKLRVLQEMLIKRGDAEKEENVAQFFQRRLGKEVFNYVISPFVASVLAGKPENLSLQHALPELYEMEQQYGSLIKGQIAKSKNRKRLPSSSGQRTSSFTFIDGMQTLTNALYSNIQDNVHLNARVTQIQHAPSGWTVTAHKEDHAFTAHFDGVLYTAPLHQLQTIRFETPIDLKLLNDVEYPSLSILLLGFRREDVRHPLDGLGMLLPDVEPFTILGTLFASTIYPHRASKGHVFLTNFIGGSTNSKLAQEPTDVLLKVTMQNLSTVLGITEQPTYVKHIYVEHSIPQYNLGYGQVKKLMEQVEIKHPGLFMAGSYRGGPSIRDVLDSSYEVARRIIHTSGSC